MLATIELLFSSLFTDITDKLPLHPSVQTASTKAEQKRASEKNI